MSEKYIILIDDEENLLKLLSYIVGRIGHDVHVFNNGKDAIEEYKKNVANVKLVITDLSMSGMTGIDVINTILSINPNEKILLITGFHKDAIEHLITSKNVAILTKPIDMKELDDTLCRLIQCKKNKGKL
jgi:DNA-binding NtrC family response regulator